MKCDSIIFDVDGTLWNSCDGVAKCWELAIKENFGGFRSFTADDVMSIMGKLPREICDMLLPEYGDMGLSVFECMASYEMRYLPIFGGIIYDGLEDTLRALCKKYPLYIVSNCPAGYIECFLEYSGLADCFSDHLCYGDTGLDKAGNIKRIIDLHSLLLPLYVGDTLSDEQSARKSGCGFIHAAYGFGSAECPDGVICSPSRLLDLLD